MLASLTHVIQESSEVGDDLCSQNELVSYTLVHDQVQVTLSESRLLVLETIMEVWQHVEAGGQQLDSARNNAELPFLCFSLGGDES